MLGNRRIGDVLVAQGVITVDQLGTLLDLQAYSDAGSKRSGDLVVAWRLATDAQVDAALVTAGRTPAVEGVTDIRERRRRRKRADVNPPTLVDAADAG